MADKTNLMLDGFLTEAENYLTITDFKTRSTGVLDTLIDAVIIAENDQDPGNKITVKEEKRIRKFAEKFPIALGVQLPSLTSTNIDGYLASLQHRADELHHRTGKVDQVDDLYKQTVIFSSFFKSKWNRLEDLKKEVSALSKANSSSFSPQRAIEVLTQIKELSNEYESMAKYHQYSNDFLSFRKLGEKYYSQMDEFKSRSILLDSDYRTLVYRLRDDPSFSKQDEITKQWIENTILRLPKRELTAAEKEEYIKLSVREVELGDKGLAQVKEVEDKKSYPISLSDFNNFVEDGDFKKTAQSKYKQKDQNIYLPASDYFLFTQKCKDRKLRDQIWKLSIKDLKQATHKIAYELLLTRARKAEILGWDNFAEYELQTSVLGNIQKVREGLTTISQTYRPLAQQELISLAAQAEHDQMPLNSGDLFYYLDHRSPSAKEKISDNQRPEYRKVLATFHAELPSLTNGAIGSVEEVNADQFKRDMPDIPLWTSPKYLRFYKFYDSSNKFIGYKIQDPFKRENKYPFYSAWEIRPASTHGKFLMIITTKFDLKGKDPTGNFFLDSNSFNIELHENGHVVNDAMRARLSQLPSDGTEVPSIATETYFALNKVFLEKILSKENAEIIYQEASEAISNPIFFNERVEFAIRNLNYHSISYAELKRLKEMDSVERKIHDDRKRYSLFRPENPDEDSFSSFDFMFYSGRADLHRYIVVNHLQKRLVDICERVGYNNLQLRALLMDYFILPNAQRSKQPLFDKLDEFEREALKLGG